MVRENRQFVTEFAEPYHHVTRSLHLDEILPNMLFEPRRIAYLRVFCDYVIHVLIFAHRAVEEFLHKRREQRVLLLRPVHLRAFYFQLVFFAQSDTRILDTGDEHLREVEDDMYYRASFFHSRNILTFLRILECSDFVFFRVRRSDAFAGHVALSVNFVTKDFPRPEFERGHRVISEPLQVFYERAQRITVRDNEHVFSRFEFGENAVCVVRHYAVVDIFHGLTALDGMVPTAPDALEFFVANLFFHFP